MSPSQQTVQQPQSHEMVVAPATHQANGVVTEQPKTGNNSMQAEPEVSMRGGGAVGDCLAALCAFECCKGICDCCC